MYVCVYVCVCIGTIDKAMTRGQLTSLLISLPSSGCAGLLWDSTRRHLVTNFDPATHPPAQPTLDELKECQVYTYTHTYTHKRTVAYGQIARVRAHTHTHTHTHRNLTFRTTHLM